LLNSILYSCFRDVGLSGVTNLTFQDHVTSSVIGTKPLSEIFSGECDGMVDMTLNNL